MMDRFNYMCTYAYVHGKCALESAAGKLKARVDRVINDESGMEIIQVILILAVVLAIAVIFRKQISEMANKILGVIQEKVNVIDEEPDPIHDPS